MRDFNRVRDNRERGDREMFDAICDECGNHCKVPFKPTGNKSIFCSHCFEKQGGSDSRRDRGRDRGRDRSFSSASASRRRDGRSFSQEREMHTAICDECGEKCEIPFKPSSDKPVFCSTCFAKKNEGRDRGSRGDNRGGGKGDDFGKQLQAITEKLNEILQALSPAKPKKVVNISTKKKTTLKKKVVKKPAKKKSAKKKTIKPGEKKTTKKAKKK
jgi:CxxC-x17-CxxC domain-containing protein